MSDSSRLRDFQRAKIYRWEDSEWWMDKDGGLSLVEVDYLCRKLFGRWHFITIKDGRGRSHAGGCNQMKAIWLPRWARTTAVVCHELAHTTTDDKHGPKFVAEYCRLLEKSGLIPSAMVARMSAIDFGIEVAD